MRAGPAGCIRPSANLKASRLFPVPRRANPAARQAQDLPVAIQPALLEGALVSGGLAGLSIEVVVRAGLERQPFVDWIHHIAAALVDQAGEVSGSRDRAPVAIEIVDR